jgi:hypothetical protein
MMILLPDEEVSHVLGHQVVHTTLHQRSVDLLVVDYLGYITIHS